jgi:hypothetical protein
MEYFGRAMDRIFPSVAVKDRLTIVLLRHLEIILRGIELFLVRTKAYTFLGVVVQIMRRGMDKFGEGMECFGRAMDTIFPLVAVKDRPTIVLLRHLKILVRRIELLLVRTKAYTVLGL